MKQIFTLITGSFIALTMNYANAQFYEGFEKTKEQLEGNCWKIQHLLSTTKTTLLEGDQSLVSESSLSNNKVQGRLTTPYIRVTTNPITIQFRWRLLNQLTTNSFRDIILSYINDQGITTQFDAMRITKDNPSTAATTTQLYARQLTLPATGVYRLQIEFSGQTGDGNQKLIFDALQIDGADFYYGPVNRCNSAPIARDDNYFGITGKPFSGNVLENDTEPNGEAVKPALIGNSSDGVIALGSNGDFTFTPNLSFTGLETSFKYQNTDNGYTPLTSTPATVTIRFTEPITLPLKMVSFTGNLQQNGSVLTWSVDENETGEKFEVERSNDGSNFQTIAHIFTLEDKGTATYKFKDSKPVDHIVYYRIKCINKNGTAAYSKVLVLRTETSGTNGIVLLQNPVTNTLNFYFASASNQTAKIVILNSFGQVVQSSLINVQAEKSFISIALNSNIGKGTYFLSLSCGSEKFSCKFIKQ